MNEFFRFKRLVSGYISREYDRIKDLELFQASQEMEQSSGPAAYSERLNTPKESAPKVALTPEEKVELARKIFEVPTDATYEQIRKSYETLMAKSDPSQYDPKSANYTKALDIQRKLKSYFELLTQHFSNTEKRFKSLEID